MLHARSTGMALAISSVSLILVSLTILQVMGAKQNVQAWWSVSHSQQLLSATSVRGLDRAGKAYMYDLEPQPQTSRLTVRLVNMRQLRRGHTHMIHNLHICSIQPYVASIQRTSRRG